MPNKDKVSFNDYTAKELAAALTEAKVEFNPKAKKPTLVKLAVKNLEVDKVKEAPVNTKADDGNDDGNSEIEVVSVKVPRGDSIDVLQGERYIRTYTREVHGAKFVDNVRSFVGKLRDENGVPLREAVPSEAVVAVKVTYRFAVYQSDTKILLRYEDKYEIFKGSSYEDKKRAIDFANAHNGSCVALLK